MELDERLIARLQLVGSAIIVAVLVLGMGILSIRQIRQEYEANIKVVEAQELQRQQEFLIQQVATAKGFLTNMRNRTEQVLQAQIREQVDEAYTLAESIYRQEKGQRSDGEIKRMIIEALRPMRFFNGKGYFFIDSMTGDCVLLPINPDREGSSLLQNQDDTGHFIMKGLIEAAKLPVGESFSHYRWYAPGDKRHMADKIAYVRTFAPFGWLIGSGHYVADVERALQDEAIERLRAFRFGKNGHGYFVVYADNGSVLISPSRPQSEGFNVTQLPEDGQKVAQLIFNQGKKADGFVRYDWAKDGGDGPKTTKLVWVSHLPGWSWTLSAGDYLDELESMGAERRAALEISIRDKMKLTFIALAIGVAVALAIGWWFSHLTGLLIGRYRADIARQNAELQRKSQALEQSNTDLEQFAYVASHDLREPLRMVSAYITLIERHYAKAFDADGMQFLHFARDGAKRMDQLVLDLLQFSRIDRLGAPIVAMTVGPAINEALLNLAVAAMESSADITVDPLVEQATVMGDAGQVARLFQNLIGNAIKYRAADRKPIIDVSATLHDGMWEFIVADNGQGIEERYFERIFGIFQRLHTRAYEGTGIGLAVCKRIAERHGGAIWLDSVPGQGTRFHITLPAAGEISAPT